jgi:cysteine desulfurase
MRKVYFDYNATTPIRPEVKEAMQPFLTDYFGNPSSLHWAGRGVRAYYHKAKGQVADLINASVDEIIFTGSGTEADNHAIKGVAYTLKEKGRHIITSTIEHPAVLNTCRYLEKGVIMSPIAG